MPLGTRATDSQRPRPTGALEGVTARCRWRPARRPTGTWSIQWSTTWSTRWWRNWLNWLLRWLLRWMVSWTLHSPARCSCRASLGGRQCGRLRELSDNSKQLAMRQLLRRVLLPQPVPLPPTLGRDQLARGSRTYTRQGATRRQQPAKWQRFEAVSDAPTWKRLMVAAACLDVRSTCGTASQPSVSTTAYPSLPGTERCSQR